MAETSPASVNVSAAAGAQLARRLGALVPGPLREPLASLRRDLHVVLEGLAGRHPSPLLPRRPHGPAPSGGPAANAGPAPRTLRVERVVRETADAVTLWLRDPSGAPIPFVAGQFFTVLVPLDGQTVRRAYSACSSPLSPDLVAITCKRTPGGRVSTFLNEQVQAGMTLQALGPSGNFTVAPEPERARHYVLLGGGSGITPLMAIARAVLHAEPRSHVALIFGNRSVDDIIFRGELAALAAAHPGRFSLRHVLQEPPPGWSGGTGLLDEETLERELTTLPLSGLDLERSSGVPDRSSVGPKQSSGVPDRSSVGPKQSSGV
ncbi:MAG TPA: FAD-binding oxidoreductase, partial [Pseudomonadota bacterium]|nr:FAD-binding oxidoreductase [Pseudomonadota bacterium]